MQSPRLIVVAGPPGSGKTSLFPLHQFGVASFNADDVAASLNGGSYAGISTEIRKETNRRFEAFIDRHIETGESFAFETTLRTAVTFEQAQRGHARGVFLIMIYVAVASAAVTVKRVAIRAEAAGIRPREISARDLPCESSEPSLAIRRFDNLSVFDNSAFGRGPEVVLKAMKGGVYWVKRSALPWLRRVVKTAGEMGVQRRNYPVCRFEYPWSQIPKRPKHVRQRAAMDLPKAVIETARSASRILEQDPYAGEVLATRSEGVWARNPLRIYILDFSIDGAMYGLAYRICRENKAKILWLFY